MPDVKISQLATGSALGGTEQVPMVQSSTTVKTTPAAIYTYTASQLGVNFGFTGTARDVGNMTLSSVNTCQVGRVVSGATGWPFTGVNASFISLPVDSTPSVAFLAATGSGTANSGRLWTGFKNSATATPVWTEMAKVDAPSFTTRIGIGAANSTATASFVNVPTTASATGAVTMFGANFAPTIASDVTTAYYAFRAAPNTAATSFTLPLWCGFQAALGTPGAGSTITSAYGVIADSSIGSSAQVTNAYGLYSNLAAGIGTSRWNLYALGSAPNYMAGALGIGNTTLTGYNLRVDRNLTGSTTAIGVRSASTVQSDVTTAAYMYDSVPSTQATVGYTLTSLAHYRAIQGTFGAGSTVTTQIGYSVDSSLIGATNNWGFRGAIPAGTNRYNLYMDGTAQNFLGGVLGLGATTMTNYTFRNLLSITGGTTAYQNQSGGLVNTDVTGTAVYNATNANTVASPFTCSNLIHYQAVQGNISGGGSSVTTQIGFEAASSLTGAATNNYGFRGAIASSTGRWNVYMDGTAQNYFAGNVGIGTSRTVPTCALDVNGLVAKSVSTGIPAAGTTLGTATALTAAYNVVTTVNAGQGVSLPNVTGAAVWIINNQGTNALNVYPSDASSTINGGAAGAALSLAANAKMLYVRTSATAWFTMF